MSRVILVTGTGRSGTSLAMQALSNMGVAMSWDLVPASGANLEGAYEDQAILAAIRKALPRMGLTGSTPRPADWQDTEAYEETRAILRRTIKRRLREGDSDLWAVKIPQASLILPLWFDVFEDLGVESRVVLCVRSLQATLRSFLANYARHNLASAQATYLFRSYYAARDLGSRAFLLGYETWGEDSRRTYAELQQYCGLEPTEEGDSPFVSALSHGGEDDPVEMPCLSQIEELAQAVGGLTCRERSLNLDRLSPVLAELDKDLARPRSTLLAALSRLASLKGEVDAYWEAEARRRGRVIGELRFDQKMLELSRSLQDADAERERKLAIAEAQLRLEQETADREKERRAFDGKQEALAAAASEQRSRAKVFKSQLVEAKRAMTDVEGKLHACEGEVQRLSEEKQRLSEENTNLRMHIDQLRADVAEQKLRARQFKQRVKELES